MKARLLKKEVVTFMCTGQPPLVRVLGCWRVRELDQWPHKLAVLTLLLHAGGPGTSSRGTQDPSKHTRRDREGSVVLLGNDAHTPAKAVRDCTPTS